MTIWWPNHMETLSELLQLHKGPVMRICDFLFSLIKLLRK